VLSGKIMQPVPGKKKTILFGKCMHQAHKDNADIREMIAIKGCPPKPDSILKAFRQAGIAVDPEIFENIRKIPGNFLKRFEGRPEFNETHFKVG
jgi:Ni,Fe-hydrogenase III small subunit